MFDLDTLLATSQESVLEEEPRWVVREILPKALKQPGTVAERLGRSLGGRCNRQVRD